MTQVKGFELFTDIEDNVLRVRNQAVTLANIADMHSKFGFISPKGATLMLSYYQEIPDCDKLSVSERAKEFMKERGFC
jgi:hypothetical protein